MKIKRTISLLTVSLMTIGAVTSFSACGNDDLSAHSLLIYTEYNGLEGKVDSEVEAAIEKKFYEDTGEEIDLVVEARSTSQLSQAVTNSIAAGERVDAVVSHYSTDSSLTTMIVDEIELKDISSLVEEYAPSYLELFNEETDPNGCTWGRGWYNKKMYALTSMDFNSIFGMLVNRDYMKQTSFDPDDYDISKEGYKSMSVSDFLQMLREMRENIKPNGNLMRPLSGAAYDIEYFLAPAFGSVSYTHMATTEGTEWEDIWDIIPGYAQEEYANVLEFERTLQEEKLWPDSTSSSNDFTAGLSGVYCSWPEVTSDIQIARTLKKAMGYDCIIMAPLLKEGSETETNGNARHETGFNILTVPKGGQNTELLLKYINWMYSSKENYELTKYGVKGVHWLEGQTTSDGTETYSYPAEKKAEYEEDTPYSGIYCLLNNSYVSYRIYDGYNETEKKWIDEVHSFPIFPADGYVDEGINIQLSTNDTSLITIATRFGLEWTNVRKYAWSPAEIPDGKTISQLHKEFREKLTVSEGKYAYKLYIDFLNDGYRQSKANLS